MAKMVLSIFFTVFSRTGGKRPPKAWPRNCTCKPQKGVSTMTSLVILWIGLGVITLALALYRKFVSMKEDDYLHIGEGEAGLIPQQVAVGNRLEWIDKWGKALTVVTVLLGLGLAAAYLYQGWIASTRG